MVGSAGGWWANRRKVGADAVSSLSDAAVRMVGEYQESIRRVQERLDRLELEQRREREWCETRIGQLVKVLREHDIEVPPPPPRGN